MASDVRRPRLSSVHDRKSTSPRESDEEEQDELVTTPATSNNGANDSDNDMDKTRLSAVHASSSHGSLSPAAEALARVVRAGLDAEQLKVIEGVRNHLGDERARQLEQRASQDLDNFVADELKANPGRDPLRKVHVSLKRWTANHKIPLTPISKNIIFIFAHEIFTVVGAVWKLDHRKTMLDMLESLRTCGNKRYRRDLEAVPVYREAFLDSIYNFPEAKALESVEKDLTLLEDESEPEDDELKDPSSDEEVAQQLTGSQPRGNASVATPPTPTSISPPSALPELEDACASAVNKRKRTATSSSDTSDEAKRQKKHSSPARPPSPVTAQNATSITDSALTSALGFQRFPRAPLPSLPLVSSAHTADDLPVSGQEASLSVPVKTGQAVRPSSPSAWGPSFGSKQGSPATTAPVRKPVRPPPTVIDLCSDTSDEEEMAVDKPFRAPTTSSTGTNHTVIAATAEQGNSVAVEQASAQTSGSTSTNVAASTLASGQRQPRPPLYPPSVAARLRELEVGSASISSVSPIHTVPAAGLDSLSSETSAEIAPITVPGPPAPHIGKIKVAADAVEAPSNAIATVLRPVQAFNQAVRDYKKDVAAKKTLAPRDTPSEVLTPPLANDLNAIPDVDMARESSSIGETIYSANESTTESAEPPYVSASTTVVKSVPSPAASHGAVPAANTQSSDGNSAPEAPVSVQTGLSAQPTADIDSGSRSDGSRVPSRAFPLFDNWDATFKELAQTVFKTLEREKPNDALLQVNNKVLEFQMGHDQRISAEFGWIRNQRRAQRQQQASAAAGSQAQQSAHWSRPLQKYHARNRTTSAQVDASLPHPRAQPLAGTASSSVTLAETVQVPSTNAQISAGVRQQEAQQAFSQSTPPVQSKAHLHKPIYPDFLKEIRKPTLVTGVLPVYLGSGRPTPAASHPLPPPPQVLGPALVATDAAVRSQATAESANVTSASSLIQSQTVTATSHHSAVPNAPLFPLQHAPANYISTISAQAGPSRPAVLASRGDAPVQRNPVPPISTQWQASPAPVEQPARQEPSRFTDITSPPQPVVPLEAGNPHKLLPAARASTIGETMPAPTAVRPHSAVPVQSARSALGQATSIGLGVPAGPPRSAESDHNLSAASRASTVEAVIGDRRVSAPLPSRSRRSQSPSVLVSGPMRRFSGYGTGNTSLPSSAQLPSGQRSPTTSPTGTSHMRRPSSPFRSYDGPSARFVPQTTSFSPGTRSANFAAEAGQPQQIGERVLKSASSSSIAPARSVSSSTNGHSPVHTQQGSFSSLPPTTLPQAATGSSTRPSSQQRTSYGSAVPAATSHLPFNDSSQPLQQHYYGQSGQPSHYQVQYQQGVRTNIMALDPNSLPQQHYLAPQQHLAGQPYQSTQQPVRNVFYRQTAQPTFPQQGAQPGYQHYMQPQYQYHQQQRPAQPPPPQHHSQQQQTFQPSAQLTQPQLQQPNVWYTPQQAQAQFYPSLQSVQSHWTSTSNNVQQPGMTMQHQIQQPGMEGITIYQAPYAQPGRQSQQQQQQQQQQHSVGSSVMEPVRPTYFPQPPQQHALNTSASEVAPAPVSAPAPAPVPVPVPVPAPASQEVASLPQERAQKQLDLVSLIAKHLGVTSDTSPSSTASTTGPLSEAAGTGSATSTASNQLVHQRSGSTTTLHSNREFGSMMETQKLIEGIAKSAAAMANLGGISKIAESMNTIGIERTYINLFQFRAFYHLGEMEKERLEEAERQRLAAQQAAIPTSAPASMPGTVPVAAVAGQTVPPASLPATNTTEAGQSLPPATAETVSVTAEVSVVQSQPAAAAAASENTNNSRNNSSDTVQGQSLT